MKFNTKEFYELVKEKSATDIDFKAMAPGFTARWQSFIRNCPGNVDRLVEWEVRNTVVTSLNFHEFPVPSEIRNQPVDEKKFLGRFSMEYPCSVKLHKQEVTAMMAIGMGDYDIDGDITEVMKLIEAFDAFIDLQSTIPAEYD